MSRLGTSQPASRGSTHTFPFVQVRCRVGFVIMGRQKSAPVRRVAAGDLSMPARQTIVAVVDDDLSMLSATKNLLEARGFSTRLFVSAEEFLACGAATEVDCLLLDIQLGGMSGIRVAAPTGGFRLHTAGYFYDRPRRRRHALRRHKRRVALPFYASPIWHVSWSTQLRRQCLKPRRSGVDIAPLGNPAAHQPSPMCSIVGPSSVRKLARPDYRDGYHRENDDENHAHVSHRRAGSAL